MASGIELEQQLLKASTARGRERILFERCIDLYHGQIGAMPGDDFGRRVLGYMAEYVAVFTDTPHREYLLGVAEACDRYKSGRVLDLFSGKPGRPSELDELARSWGFSRGISRSRLRGEWAALEVERLHPRSGIRP